MVAIAANSCSGLSIINDLNITAGAGFELCTDYKRDSLSFNLLAESHLKFRLPQPRDSFPLWPSSSCSKYSPEETAENCGLNKTPPPPPPWQISIDTVANSAHKHRSIVHPSEIRSEGPKTI